MTISSKSKSKPGTGGRHAVLTRAQTQAVRCPRCRALVGEPCIGRSDYRVRHHLERRREARARV